MSSVRNGGSSIWTDLRPIHIGDLQFHTRLVSVYANDERIATEGKGLFNNVHVLGLMRNLGLAASYVELIL
jgi:hypothetical protein